MKFSKQVIILIIIIPHINDKWSFPIFINDKILNFKKVTIIIINKII